MKKNMGSLDKNLRLVLGIILLIVGFFSTWWLSLIGVIMIGTSVMGFCPAYLPFNISTLGKPKE
jgi:hypothetical protein